MLYGLYFYDNGHESDIYYHLYMVHVSAQTSRQNDQIVCDEFYMCYYIRSMLVLPLLSLI